MVIRRGEVWWAELPDPSGSGPGFRRPVLVVQAGPFNDSRIRTVVVVPLTANLRLSAAPGNVLMDAKTSRLPHDSVVNVSQILTLDKALLSDLAGCLPPRLQQRIDDGLRLVLDL